VSTSNWLSLIYLVAFLAFFVWMNRGMHKLSRYDDPAYQRKQDELAERRVQAMEKSAQATLMLATAMNRWRMGDRLPAQRARGPLRP
jgi:hypothetical protein